LGKKAKPHEKKCGETNKTNSFKNKKIFKFLKKKKL
jgi:hypothetical protein